MTFQTCSVFENHLYESEIISILALQAMLYAAETSGLGKEKPDTDGITIYPADCGSQGTFKN